jgi:hypothetical protein
MTGARFFLENRDFLCTYIISWPACKFSIFNALRHLFCCEQPLSTQHRGAGRRSADENLMFEGIGSNSQQAGLRICRTNALLANL